MKRILSIILLFAVVLLCLPKEFFHDHEEKIATESSAHMDEDCFVCDLDLSLFESIVGTVLGLLSATLIVHFVAFGGSIDRGAKIALSTRGPPAFS